MKPPPFRYHDPQTRAEAIGLLGKLDNAKILAGGQSLMPMLNMRFVLPDHVIDLNGIEDLAFLTAGQGHLEIGAMTRQCDLEASPVVRAQLPILVEALQYVGHLQTRNRGTIGGSLCHLDPAAEQVAVAAACEATVTVAGPNGERRLPFAEFALDYMTPALDLDELLVSVSFPTWASGHGYGFVEFARRHGDFAIVSAAALLEAGDDGRITRAALALGGVGPVPLKMTEVERALLGERPSEQLFAEASQLCTRVEALGDALVPASYRQQLAGVLARRSLMIAQQRLAGTREAGSH